MLEAAGAAGYSFRVGATYLKPAALPPQGPKIASSSLDEQDSRDIQSRIFEDFFLIYLNFSLPKHLV